MPSVDKLVSIFETMAPGALGPGLAAAGVFLVAWLVARVAKRPTILRLGALVAVATGFAVGFVVILRWPELPLARSTDGWYWVAWLAPAGVLLGLLEHGLRMPFLARLALRLLASAGAAWLILSPVKQVPSGRELIVAVAAVGSTLLWTLLAAARQDEPPERSGLPAAMAPGLAAAVLAFFASSASMGQVTGGLSAALSAPLALAVVLRVKGTSIAAPAAAVTALVFGGLLVSAYGYLNYGGAIYVPASVPLLLLGGAVLGLVLARLLPTSLGRIPSALIVSLAPLALSAIAAWIADAHALPPNPYG